MSKKQTKQKALSLNFDDVQEIADSITGIENDDLDLSKTEDAIYKKYDVSLDAYESIVADIFQRLDFGVSPFTQEAFVGFLDKNKRMWLAKKEVNQQFIAGIIDWATEGNKLTKKQKGFVKTITKNGVPEYDIVIRHPEKVKK